MRDRIDEESAQAKVHCCVWIILGFSSWVVCLEGMDFRGGFLKSWCHLISLVPRQVALGRTPLFLNLGRDSFTITRTFSLRISFGLGACLDGGELRPIGCAATAMAGRATAACLSPSVGELKKGLPGSRAVHEGIGASLLGRVSHDRLETAWPSYWSKAAGWKWWSQRIVAPQKGGQ